jgi:hypothetical protein
MKLIEIMLLIVVVILLVNITKPNSTIHKVVNHEPTPQPITASQEDILIENRGPPVKTTGNFPIPQSTTTSNILSTNVTEDLSIITQGSTIPHNDIIHMDRSSIQPANDSHFPQYYRKDTMSGSTVGTTEYKFAEIDTNKSDLAWSDDNVSQYPSYYTSQIKGGLTNVGAFFDQNNQFVDTTNPRSTVNVSDVCFMSKEGENICLDNSRLQNVPPSLISDTSNCGFLNSIGLLEFSNLIYEDKERVNNGGVLYGNVKGSKTHNESYSAPLTQETLTCQL